MSCKLVPLIYFRIGFGALYFWSGNHKTEMAAVVGYLQKAIGRVRRCGGAQCQLEFSGKSLQQLGATINNWSIFWITRGKSNSSSAFWCTFPTTCGVDWNFASTSFMVFWFCRRRNCFNSSPSSLRVPCSLSFFPFLLSLTNLSHSLMRIY